MISSVLHNIMSKEFKLTINDDITLTGLVMHIRSPCNTMFDRMSTGWYGCNRSSFCAPYEDIDTVIDMATDTYIEYEGDLIYYIQWIFPKGCVFDIDVVFNNLRKLNLRCRYFGINYTGHEHMQVYLEESLSCDETLPEYERPNANITDIMAVFYIEDMVDGG